MFMQKRVIHDICIVMIDIFSRSNRSNDSYDPIENHDYVQYMEVS